MGKGQGSKLIGSERNFEFVMRQLREMFESSRLRPGEKLPAEPVLAAQFGVPLNVGEESQMEVTICGESGLYRPSQGVAHRYYGAFTANWSVRRQGSPCDRAW